MNAKNEILSVRDVCKIFGDKPEAAMEMLRTGADKDEVFAQTGQAVGVWNAEFSVRKGEIFVIVGLSGSGKSTLVRLLNRLIEPTSGSIYLDGREITGLSEKELLDVRRTKMSMVFQSFALMPHMTCLDNAAFGLEVAGIDNAERNRRARQALAQVGLAEHESSYPHQLSGGMQQRVGLARALTSDPAILLMDEAFSALDPLIRTEMQDQLLRLQKEQQRTIVFISHDLDEAIRIGDRIAIMEGGRIVQIGTPSEILRDPADDYVRDFFKSVDASKVLTAGDVASVSPDSLVRLNGAGGAHTLNSDYGYLVDDGDQLKGVVSAAELSGEADAEGLLQRRVSDHASVPVNTPLREMLSTVANTPYPVPVVDAGGRFHGTVSKDDLLLTIHRD